MLHGNNPAVGRGGGEGASGKLRDYFRRDFIFCFCFFVCFVVVDAVGP